MPVNISINTNTVAVQENINYISVNDPNNPNIVDITQPVTNTVEIITAGPQGPPGPTANTGSLLTTASFNQYTGSSTSQFAGTSSFATTAATASFVTASNVYGPFGSNSILSSSFTVSSSRAVTASFAQTAPYSGLQGTVPTWNQSTTGNAATATTASFALTSSNISPAVTNNSNNLLLTATGTGTINGESNLRFDGTTLTATSGFAQGEAVTASGGASHAQGIGTVASGDFSHAEGESTQAIGYFSHAEGRGSISSGTYSHAEGSGSTSSGHTAHTEGFKTQATATGSHAEGASTLASGDYSHAEGASTLAQGEGAHAEGYNTVASGSYQHVQGQFNISSSAQSAFIVGNGTSNANRSNLIFASGSQVQITGSLQISGSLTITGSNTIIGNQTITGSLLVSSSNATQFLVGNVISQKPSFGSSPNVTIGSGSDGGVLDIRNTSTSSPNATNVGTIQFTVQSSAGDYTQTQLKSISAGGQSGGASGGGHLTFLTSTGETGAVPLERMMITNYGNVGIGTNNPLTTLHAEGSIVGPIVAKYRSIIYANNTSIGGAYNNAIGLYAEVATTDGIAVYGNSTDSNGFGGYFVGKGYFSGNIITDGSASISGSVTATSGLIGPGASLAAPIFNGFVPNLSIGMPTGSSGAVLNLTNTSAGTISAGDTLGTIQFAGTDYLNNSQPYVSSQIRATTTDQIGSGNSGGGNVAIWTSTTGNGTSPIERMRVNNYGQILIGLTSSLNTTSKLIVSGSTVVTGSVTSTGGFIKPGAGSEYLLADGTTTAGGSGGTSLGLVQAISLGLQNIF